MKKTVHILFTGIFILVTLGFTINKHYSSGELFSFALFAEPESCCADICSCCEEETVTVQFLADYLVSVESFEEATIELELFPIEQPLEIAKPESVLVSNEITDQDLPPPDNQTKLSFYQTYLL